MLKNAVYINALLATLLRFIQNYAFSLLGRSTANKAKHNCKLCKDSRCRNLVKEMDVFKHGSEIYSRPITEKYEMFRDEDGYIDNEVIKHKQIDGQWEKSLPTCIEGK